MIKKIIHIIFFALMINLSSGQTTNEYPFYPSERIESNDWKYQLSVYAQQHANSNSLTNEFFDEINKSGFISKDLINNQIEQLSEHILSGQITSIGMSALIRSARASGNRFYLIEFEHQQYFDSYIDRDLAKFLLQGNKPYAGQTLQFPDSRYYNTYFNQLRGGMGFRFQKDGLVQFLNWTLGFVTGQNFESIEINNSSLYTHPTGDELELEVMANTRNSDTVWADIYQVNGFGLSTGMEYSLKKINQFFFSIMIKNLGLINWNGNTFQGKVDTSFVFEGISNDTLSGRNDLPTDYSYNNLRTEIFTNPESGAFNDMLPVSFQISGGKYFGDGRFYAGLNGTFYPTLDAKYRLEFFGTWNFKSTLYLTPVITYGSYNKVNIGLGLGVQVFKKLAIYAGSGYLNSFFDKNAALGSGGFVRLTFIN